MVTGVSPLTAMPTSSSFRNIGEPALQVSVGKEVSTSPVSWSPVAVTVDVSVA